MNKNLCISSREGERRTDGTDNWTSTSKNGSANPFLDNDGVYLNGIVGVKKVCSSYEPAKNALVENLNIVVVQYTD
jgi:hypothetical protein